MARPGKVGVNSLTFRVTSRISLAVSSLPRTPSLDLPLVLYLFLNDLVILMGLLLT
jgi:hypothetical protein